MTRYLSQANETTEAGYMELTILMPCLNEAETLEICIKKAKAFLASSGVDGEVMIADNGSTDGSQDIARANGAVVVDVPARGYGAALLGGIEASRARFVIMGDADDSYDFSNLMPYVERLRAGADLVMGNRFKGGIAEGAMPFLHKYLGNPVLSFLGRLFFNVPIGDFHCGLRGFNRESIRSLKLVTPGMEFASEMVVKSALSQLRIDEVPTTLKPDGRSRPPHLRTWRDGWRHLRFLLIFSPRYLYLVPGLVLLAIGVGGMAWLWSGPREVMSDLALDVHSFVGFTMIAVLAVQILLFGVLSRGFASIFGIRRETRVWMSLATSLELMLVLALIAVLGGLAGAWWCFSEWARVGYASLEYGKFLRPFVSSLAALLAGTQMAFTAFFASSFAEYFKHSKSGG
ncbi:glycosyltransferase family 2 protein [Pseudoxanthomonas kaohsiungensis]|uniref:Glycosyltransferase family 2 protein n=4 Tax=Lysobacterales TaxID=135614 RepID=A0ABW3LR26_9GAMM|nr:glycosyltransferase family 2 protein [Pseudoxanthomonas kaohsiungensis]